MLLELTFSMMEVRTLSDWQYRPVYKRRSRRSTEEKTGGVDVDDYQYQRCVVSSLNRSREDLRVSLKGQKRRRWRDHLRCWYKNGSNTEMNLSILIVERLQASSMLHTFSNHETGIGSLGCRVAAKVLEEVTVADLLAMSILDAI